MKTISNFRDKYFFLANFYYCPLTLQGVTYPSAEHAFQAMKTLDVRKRKKIAAIATPGEAKKFGRNLRLRSEWDSIKVSKMHAVVSRKFSNPELADKLLATGGAMLIEGNACGDAFWGVSREVGENHLGKILMKVREELR